MTLRSQITLAIEHIQMTSSSRQIDDLSHDFAPDPASPNTTREMGHKKEDGHRSYLLIAR
jgi:hypothetical protein